MNKMEGRILDKKLNHHLIQLITFKFPVAQAFIRQVLPSLFWAVKEVSISFCVNLASSLPIIFSFPFSQAFISTVSPFVFL